MTEKHRTLVVADAATTSPEFAQTVAAKCEDGSEVFLVTPNRDRTRVARAVSALASEGVFAWGRTGPSDPLSAIADALRQFAADAIVVVGDMHTESHRLGISMARRAFREFGLPVGHVRVGYVAAAAAERGSRANAAISSAVRAGWSTGTNDSESSMCSSRALGMSSASRSA